MVDTKAVGLSQGADHGDHVAKKFTWGELTALDQQFTECKAINIFHDNKYRRGAPLVPALVLDRNNIWVGEGGDRLRFADKSIYKLFVICEVTMHDLDGHKSIETSIGGFVNSGHASRCYE